MTPSPPEHACGGAAAHGLDGIIVNLPAEGGSPAAVRAAAEVVTAAST